MSINKKHSRSLTVKGNKYLWKIRDNGDNISISIQETSCYQTFVYHFWRGYGDCPEEITPSVIKHIIEAQLIPRKQYLSWKPQEKDAKKYKKMSYTEIVKDVWGQLPFSRDWELEVLGGESPMPLRIRSRQRDSSDRSRDMFLCFRNRADIASECYIAFNMKFSETQPASGGNSAPSPPHTTL